MNVFLCGADGFIGRHLEVALSAAGHHVRRGVRRPSRVGDVEIDYRSDLDPTLWRERLAGCDAVINAVGILTERCAGDFERIHRQAPAALFAAAGAAGVRRVVQISALGAATRRTPYLASKADADAALAATCLSGTVVRPSLVFGDGGASTAFFLALASLPVIVLPGGGAQRLRPIHIDDLCALIVGLLADPSPPGSVDAVGGGELSYAGLLAAYRQALGFAPALAIPLPAALMPPLARLAGLVPGSLLTPATWDMLAAGNTADPGPCRRALGRTPRPPARFIAAPVADALRQSALAAWRPALLRGALGFVWLVSGTTALAKPQTGLDLLAAFGLSGGLAGATLWAASGLDLAMAVLTFLRPGRRLWLAQIALIVAYTLLVAWRLPEFLVHPFAPLAKNLPIVAALLLLWAEERQP